MYRAGRSPLFAALRRAFGAALRENRHSLAGETPRLNRRRFVAGTAAGLMAAYTRPARASQSDARIAVVGAGIAGLNATYLLAKAGLSVSLYEGSDHIGGRIQTAYGAVAPGVFSELGGEFIDSDHADMLALASTFGFGLIDTEAPSEAGLQIAYYADGRLRSEAQVIAAFKHLAAVVNHDLAQLSNQITFNSHSPFDAQLDHTTLQEYLRRTIGTGWLYDVLAAAYVNEFGLDMAEQSSLNFVTLIGTDTSNGFEIYGTSDQRYKVQGGNHQIVAALANQVADRLLLGYQLEALAQRPSGEYVLNFATGGGRSEVTADIVVLCIPFTVLRHIDLRVPLPAIKKKAIHELGYGVDAKLILGFQGRPWRGSGTTATLTPTCRINRVGTAAGVSPRQRARTRSTPEGPPAGRWGPALRMIRRSASCPASTRCSPACRTSGSAPRSKSTGRRTRSSGRVTPPIVPGSGPASAAPSPCRWVISTSPASTRASTGRVT